MGHLDTTKDAPAGNTDGAETPDTPTFVRQLADALAARLEADNDRWLSMRGVSELTGISTSQLRRLQAEGRFLDPIVPPRGEGKGVSQLHRFWRSEVLEWMRAQPRQRRGVGSFAPCSAQEGHR